MIGLFAFTALQLTTGWTPPAKLPEPQVEGPSAEQPRRIEPIGSYTLALIWTPQHCVERVPGAESFRCGTHKGSGFVLHGLWPDGLGKSWPQWCKDAPALPSRLLRRHYRATPSAQLMQHEWAKHGTCMGVSPAAYFRLSNRLLDRLRYPDMRGLARTPIDAGRFAEAFAAANPGMRPDMINLNLDRDGWLREVWLCYDMRFRNETCATRPPADRIIRIRLPD